jgi:hypothetical protein
MVGHAIQGPSILLLVGYKSDMKSEREVSTEDGVRLARLFGCHFMETSAKNGRNVELIFTSVVQALRGDLILQKGNWQLPECWFLRLVNSILYFLPNLFARFNAWRT